MGFACEWAKKIRVKMHFLNKIVGKYCFLISPVLFSKGCEKKYLINSINSHSLDLGNE